MKKYDHSIIESKWRQRWEKDQLYLAKYPSKKPKFYCLDFFPYPSGEGLHVGHFKGYTATDVISRYLRMKGYNVLHPMGWDAFGLPAENYAIQTGIHPKISTQKNIAKIKKQMKAAGFSYDWTREFATTDGDYYKWTQWIFLQLYKAGLAYEAEAPINWCPSCKTGLANEEVINSRCERCGYLVGKKKLRQWFLKITAFADKLLSDLDELDWPEAVKTMQRNWIGRSEGTLIKFQIPNSKFQIEVFTTRPDTLFGATFMVLAPEHELVGEITTGQRKKEVSKYVKQSLAKSDIQRVESKEKTGVATGAYAVNPVNGKKIPIWVANYVLAGYGTGAIMAVPAHDQRDFEFAVWHKLPIVEVIVQPKKDNRGPQAKRSELGVSDAYEGEGKLANSGQFDGLDSKVAAKKITGYLRRHHSGHKAINYKLRDWLFSRQRYWGEPIPIIHCQKCGTVPVDETDLPVKLPEVKSYQPTGTGESPLAAILNWVNTTCWKCGGSAKRETNTMPQWAGSCWYYLRFCDPKNDKKFIDYEKEKYWMAPGSKGKGGVDWYVGGAEHAVLHLLYARFWHKFLYGLGVVSTKEPFAKLRNVGLVLGEGGIKMSKSKGNVISPDEIIDQYGADTLRIYELFMGPFDQMIAWDAASVGGVYRFLGRVWRLVDESAKNSASKNGDKFVRLVHWLTKKVEEDIWQMRFNTAIAAMMEFVNEVSREKEQLSAKVLKHFILLLAPFAPYMTEELWRKLGESYSIHEQTWPKYNRQLAEVEKVTVAVQVNGKLRDTIEVESGLVQEQLISLAKSSDKVQKFISNTQVKRTVVVADKIVNFVTQ